MSWGVWWINDSDVAFNKGHISNARLRRINIWASQRCYSLIFRRGPSYCPLLELFTAKNISTFLRLFWCWQYFLSMSWPLFLKGKRNRHPPFVCIFSLIKLYNKFFIMPLIKLVKLLKLEHQIRNDPYLKFVNDNFEEMNFCCSIFILQRYAYCVTVLCHIYWYKV